MRRKGELMRKRQPGARTGASETRAKPAEGLSLHEKDLIRTIFQHHPDIIYFKDSEARFCHVNQRFCDFFGYGMEDIIGKTTLGYFPEETAMEIYHEDLQIIKTGTTVINKELCVDGVCLATTKVQWVGKEGNVVGLIGISRDITERKEAQEELNLSEKRYKNLFETMAEGVVLIAASGHIIQSNPAAQRLLGLTKSEINGASYIGPEWDFVYLDGTPMPPEAMAGPRAMKDQQAILNQEMGVRHPDGSITWINVSVNPMTDDSGEFQGIVVTFGDITERKHQEAKVDRLDQLMRAVFDLCEFINKETDPDNLIKGVCDALIKARDYNHAYITLLDETGNLVAAAETGLGEEFLTVVEQWKLGRLPVCALRALSNSKVTVTTDMVPCCDCPLIGKCGNGNSLCVRLEHEGRIYGLLSIFTTNLYEEDEEELYLIRRVGGDIAFVLYNIELENQRRRAVDTLVEMIKFL